MAVMARDTWTDKRLDDLNKRVGEGFRDLKVEDRAIRAEMRTEFQAVRLEMKTEFAAVRAEMAAMHRSLVQLMVGGFITMAVGFGGTIATILLTQA